MEQDQRARLVAALERVVDRIQRGETVGVGVAEVNDDDSVSIQIQTGHGPLMVAATAMLHRAAIDHMAVLPGNMIQGEAGHPAEVVDKIPRCLARLIHPSPTPDHVCELVLGHQGGHRHGATIWANSLSDLRCGERYLDHTCTLPEGHEGKHHDVVSGAVWPLDL